MASLSLGHYGAPATLLAGAALLALVAHVAVPYAHVDPRAPGAGSTWVDRGEAKDLHDGGVVAGVVVFEMTGLSSPSLTLTGTILLLVAGLALVGLGFLPLPVHAARWAGWSAGAVATAGGVLALTSSLLWVGSGFGQGPQAVFGGPSGIPGAGGTLLPFGGLTGGVAGLLEMATSTDSAGTVWVVGPSLVVVLSVVAVLCALRVCRNVVSTENGYRDRAAGHLRGAHWALAFLAAVLIVPWSLGQVADYAGETDDEGNPDRDAFFVGAHTAANAAKRSDGDRFGGLGYAVSVFAATAWIGMLMALLGAMGGVMASTGAPAPAARATHFTAFGTAFLLFWASILYLLAWAYMWKPGGGVRHFQPGYFPILVLPVLALWWTQQAGLLRNTFTGHQAASAAPVSFE